MSCSRTNRPRVVLAALLLVVIAPSGASGHHVRRSADVDLADFGIFTRSYGPSLPAGCEVFDTEPDFDVDLADYAGLQMCFRGEGVTPPGICARDRGYHHDTDDDNDVDLADFAGFAGCFEDVSSNCLAAHDFDDTGLSDGQIDLADYAGFFACLSGPGVTPPSSCARGFGRSTRGDETPPSGTFALHGRPVDVLSDGKVLFYIRARYYDPVNGRWLQRDPTGYADGNNLYESFANNAVGNVDPLGTEVWAEARRVKTTLRGVPVWRVEYALNRDGVSLGTGGLIWRDAIETEFGDTEYFAYTEDWKTLRWIDAVIESRRRAIEAGQIANIQIVSLEQGIKTSAMVAVALPVAAVAAPAASAAFGTSLAGTAAAGAVTGGVSIGAGEATGEALIGGSAGDIAIAGAKGTAFGVVTGGVIGGGARLLAGGSSTGRTPE